jgi:hypothetical protein
MKTSNMNCNVVTAPETSRVVVERAVTLSKERGARWKEQSEAPREECGHSSQPAEQLRPTAFRNRR